MTFHKCSILGVRRLPLRAEGAWLAGGADEWSCCHSERELFQTDVRVKEAVRVESLL